MKNKLLLLGVFSFPLMCLAQSKVIFNYDTAGNQQSFIYCGSGGCQALTEDAEIIEIQNKNSEQIENSLESEISVYPNPTKDNLIISWKGNFSNNLNKIQLIDVLGKSYLIDFDKEQDQAKIQMSHLSQGLYLLKIYLNDGRILNKKIIKN